VFALILLLARGRPFEGTRLCRLIGQRSRARIERVLALVAIPAAIADPGSLRLFQCGALDVLASDSTRPVAVALAARFKRWQRLTS
jgi:hypothetical protein